MFEPPFPDEDPSPELLEMAKNLRQMYVALASMGFTENQAMHIIGITVASAMQVQNPGSGPQNQ